MKTYQGHTNITYSLGGAFGTYGTEEPHRNGSGSARARTHARAQLERSGVQERANRHKAFLVSGSETGEVLWWDVQSKEVLQKETAHDGPVLDVDTWDGDEGGLAVSCGIDRTIRVWAMQEGGGDGDGREESGEGRDGREEDGDEGQEVEIGGEEEEEMVEEEEGEGEDLDI